MSSVTFKGNPVQLSGKTLSVGDTVEEITLKAQDLSDIVIGAKGKTQILLPMPSLDTPACATEARDFNKKVASYPNVEVVVVSLDLPFAMGRFCSTEGIENLKVASDFVSREFGEKYGVLMKDGPLKGLYARAVFIVKDGKVTYKELVSEVTELPNMQAIDQFFAG
ncbi:thiol peroxidase [Campylobacter sp. MIT 99-7217]|uniref:thiol peroxidase n=1 Tax=Campylobacter sp. MIT 99-7217 TaxID=535091 RepID=UPI00115BA8D7|nr:thiol peroxidase [Campylobacter sp. MIT 99-7217]TQR34653.1 thiol peroxidase [Campylobacter sp. MIT 99-7217]